MLDDSFPPQIKSQLKLSDGLFLDLSGEGNTITNNGATLTADHRGRANKAFQTTASLQAITAGDVNLDIYTNQQMTIHLGFLNNNEARNSRTIVYKSGELVVSLRNDFGFEVIVGTYATNYIRGNTTSAGTRLNNNWYLFTLVYDGTLTGSARIRMYLDGVSLNYNYSTAGFTGIPNTINALDFLGMSAVANSHFNSSVDYIHIDNRVHSPSEISQLYNEWRK